MSAANLLAMKLSLRGLRAPGVVITKAKFIECDIEGADTDGDLAGPGGLPQVQPSRISSPMRSLRQVRLWFSDPTWAGANLSRADLTEANLRETAMPGADLDDAIIEGADFSGADPYHRCSVTCRRCGQPLGRGQSGRRQSARRRFRAGRHVAQ